MKLESVELIAKGKFIDRYNLHYKSEKGNEKIYEMVTTDKALTVDSVNNDRTTAVVIVPFNEDKTKILLNKEFRLAPNTYVMNFPAGMIDAGETLVDAAKRELKEETGMDIRNIFTVLPNAFSALGVSNEKTQMIFCIADGEIGGNNDEFEEIEARWYTKHEVRTLLYSAKFSARTQLLCYLWAFDLLNM